MVNGLRLALAPHGGLSVHHERLLWRCIVRHADRKWRFASLFLGGTQVQQFLTVARHAARITHRLTHKKVVLKPLWRKDVVTGSRALGSAVGSLKAKGCAAILAGIDSQHASHWTVVTGISTSTLRILDSGGFHFLKLAGCRLDMRPRPKGQPRYWVRLYGGFAVEVPKAKPPPVKGKPKAAKKKPPRRKRTPASKRTPNATGGHHGH